MRSLLVLLPLAACTSVDLYLPEVEPPPPPERVSHALEGVICPPDPATLVYPVKIWFVLDNSDSMRRSDPNKVRFSAARQLATANVKPQAVYAGGMLFAGRADMNTLVATRTFSMPRFIDSAATFNAVVPSAAPLVGGTPYLTALSHTYVELANDIVAMGPLAKRTRYVVIFVSDGKPTDSIESDIVRKVDDLELLRVRAGGLTLNTLYVGGGDAEAVPILRSMAAHGFGEFKSVPNGDAIDFRGFDISAIRRAWVMQSWLVTNASVLPTAQGPLLDADRDGLHDGDEVQRGTDVGKRDTDGDGCSDLLEVKSSWNPLARVASECTCEGATATTDTDSDGLSDCEEAWLGSAPNRPDTDADGLIDALDLQATGWPVRANAGADQDSDGVGDLTEATQHTAVDRPDTERVKWAYVYSPERPTEGRAECRSVRVENITLLPGGEPDGNLLEVHVGFVARDDPTADAVFQVARLKAPSGPTATTLTFEPKSFELTLVTR